MNVQPIMQEQTGQMNNQRKQSKCLGTKRKCSIRLGYFILILIKKKFWSIFHFQHNTIWLELYEVWLHCMKNWSCLNIVNAQRFWPMTSKLCHHQMCFWPHPTLVCQSNKKQLTWELSLTYQHTVNHFVHLGLFWYLNLFKKKWICIVQNYHKSHIYWYTSPHF